MTWTVRIIKTKLFVQFIL